MTRGPAQSASGYGFSSPAAALDALLARLRPVGTERVDLAAAGGRVLAESLLADRPSPATDVSAMDGYAVDIADLSRGRIPVAGEIRIGHPPPAMAPGAALKIVTGAPVPAGADAVIKREEVEEHADHILVPRGMETRVRVGEHIRRAGENIAAGAEIVGAGTRITPAVVGALAAFGAARPLVHKKVRIGILVTGDELLCVDSKPEPWQIRDSNAHVLSSLLASDAACDVLPPRHAPDQPGPTRDAIADLLSRCELLFISGGVSMGDRDYVPGALKQLGAEVLFHRLPQRPGKPILAAIIPGGKIVLALPGNPVSTLVTARRFGVPAVCALAGVSSLPVPSSVRLLNADAHQIDLWWHRIVRIVEPGKAELLDNRGSGDLVSASRSDGFVEMPPASSGAGPWPFYEWRA